jgi:hypothetical protein
VFVSAPLDSIPDVAFVPDQAPEAVQEVAFVEDQVSVDDPPLVTAVGFAVIDTVGAVLVSPPATVIVGAGGGWDDGLSQLDAIEVSETIRPASSRKPHRSRPTITSPFDDSAEPNARWPRLAVE